jgi:NAD(P)H-hydrate repair Nnr-like enzyme with NAD(P)H-hydrate dehydratase domain
LENTYWKKQTSNKPLYPDVEWNKPEQRSQAGRLGIIGGNKLGFAGVGEAYGIATASGVGEVRVLLPDALKKMIPPVMTDVIFGATNPSGSLARDAHAEMQAIAAWATGVILIGDAGRNSETAILYEDFLKDYTGPLTITRDAIDLIKNSASTIVERPDTLLVISFAQLQKLFQSVYYPRILTFSMQLAQLVDALHKFTITYPVTIMVLHNEYIVVAHNGDVTTTEWQNPMAIWRGSVAAKAASYWLWNPKSALVAATASIAHTDQP